MKSKITVIGIGPGHEGDMTSRAIEALRNASVIVGYNYYIPFISHLLKEDAEIVKNGMKQEQKRIEKAVQIAGNGQDVCVVGSGRQVFTVWRRWSMKCLRKRVSMQKWK